jgi:DNA-binding winged helix-turn-helix (wHTH) protein/WD40 repeat protein
MLLETNGSYDFGPFTLRVRNKTLVAAGAPVDLGQMGIDVLIYLIANRDSLISRTELAREVWKAEKVSDDAVYRQISDIRKSLAEFDDATDYIENKKGLGWRFVGPVKWRAEPAAQVPAPAEYAASEMSQFPRRGWPKMAYVAVAGGLAIAAVAILWGIRAPEPLSGLPMPPWRKITNDGLPKDGRLFTDGRLLYFNEHVSHYAHSEARLAAVPVAGGDVTYPATPMRPATLADMGARTGDRLYWNGDIASLLLWRSKEGSLEATGLNTDDVSISPEGLKLAYGGADCNLHIRDLGPPAVTITIPVRGQAGRLRWSIDGKRIRFTLADDKLLTASLWEVLRDGTHLGRLPIQAPTGKRLWAEGWTADGLYFIFSETGNADHHSSLWIVADDSMGLKRAKPVKLSNAIDFRSAVAAPDGSAIFAIGAATYSELARFDFEKREFVRFWEGFPAIDIAFSNDGAWAAFARYPESTIWVSRADGSDRRRITWSNIEAHQPHWSPDGRQIAFMGKQADKPWRVYLVSASGGVPIEVKPNDSFDQGVPSWSADGRYLVFGELRDRKPDAEMMIRVIDLKTGTETVLPGSKGKWSPRWSPDGRTILAQTTDFKEVDMFDCESQTWSYLVARAHSDDAAWSADGKFVHFSADAERGRALFRVRVKDGKVEQLAPQPEFENSWSGVAPDGSPLTLRAIKIEEIYAIDLKQP